MLERKFLWDCNQPLAVALDLLWAEKPVTSVSFWGHTLQHALCLQPPKAERCLMWHEAFAIAFSVLEMVRVEWELYLCSCPLNHCLSCILVPWRSKYIITGNLGKMSNHLQFSSTSIIQRIKNQVKDLQLEFVTVSLIWDVCITNKIEDYKKKCPETCQPPNPRAKMQVKDVLQWWSSLGAQFHKTLLKL